MKKLLVHGFAVLLMSTIVCSVRSVAADAPAAFRAAADAKYAVKSQAFRTTNAELLKRVFYGQDAIILTDDHAIVGGEAIYEAYTKLLPSRKDIAIVSLRSAISRDGTLAYDVTRVQATAADPAQKLPEQTILFVWRRIGKEWRVAVEMSVKGAENIPPLQ